MALLKSKKNNSDLELYDVVGIQGGFLTYKLLQNFVVSVCVKTDERLDNDLLLQAVNEEIERNEGLRVRLKKVDGVWKQYIIDPFRLDSLECIDVSNGTLAEAEECVDQISDRKMSLTRSEPTFQFVHFVGPDNQDFFLFSILHAYSDGYAASLVLKDTLSVYFRLAKKLEDIPPLSSVREYFARYFAEQERNKEKYRRAREYYVNLYDKLGEPLYLRAKKNSFDFSKSRATQPIPKLYKKVFMYRTSIPGEVNIPCIDFCKKELINHNAVLLTAFSIYYFAMCEGRNDITHTITLDMRGTKYLKQLPYQMYSTGRLRTVIDLNSTFRDAAKLTDNEYMMMLRHAAFNGADHDQYCTERYQNGTPDFYYAEMLFNRTVVDQDTLDKFHVETYWPCPKKVMDPVFLYLLVMDSSDKSLTFNYRYQIDVYQEKDIQNLHNGMVRILTRAMENPDLTVKELMEEFM